jgi:uncharacterized protein YegJ (DUF2314 family)
LGRLKTLLGALLLASVLAIGSAASPGLAEDQVINVPSQDAAMNAAIAKARAGLPAFWTAIAEPAPGTESYAIKVRISEGDKVEHFWASDVQRQDGRITAVIANEPQIVGTVRVGQRIEVPEADISDWMYMRKGKIVGNETLRVLLGYMSADEAAQWKAMLEEP